MLWSLRLLFVAAVVVGVAVDAAVVVCFLLVVYFFSSLYFDLLSYRLVLFGFACISTVCINLCTL